MKWFRLRCICTLCVGIFLTRAMPAHGQPNSAPTHMQAARERLGLSIEASPLLGEASLQPGAFGELLVRVHNGGSSTFVGQVEIFDAPKRWNNSALGRVTSPLEVAANSSVTLQLPVRVGQLQGPLVRVLNERGKALFEKTFTATNSRRSILLNVARSRALRAQLDGERVPTGYDRWSNDNRYGNGSPRALVRSAPYDPISGGPLLPLRAAGYYRISAVLIRSDDLIRLGAEQREALSGYVLSGGTLALVITRPEDMRHPIIAAMAGGEVQPAPSAPPLLAPITLPTVAFNGAPGGSTVGQTSRLPSDAEPSAEVAANLRGYRGGNLLPSRYGASANYGLGEVHLLGFDPNQPPNNDDPWTHVRLIDMLRRADERLSGSLIRHGEPAAYNNIRNLLDPNRSTRWAIAVATLLLIAYAIVAGPGIFSHYRRRHQPLRAVFALPLLSVGAFALVFLLGLVAKGVVGRARHITIVDAGAGMSIGVARRYRMFFVPTARSMNISATTTSAVLTGGQRDESSHTVVDHHGMHLTGVSLHPWEAYVVREDDYVNLADGIHIVADAAGEPVVINRTGQAMSGVVLVHHLSGHYLPWLDDGARATLADFRPIGAPTSTQHWSSGMDYRPFDVYLIADELQEIDDRLSNSWSAVIDSTVEPRDWFVADVPVVLAQLAAGEGFSHDSGLAVDQQRLLVRVVGWGGEL